MGLMDQIAEAIQLAEQELEFCNIHDTPYICSAILDPIKKDKILLEIITIVVRRQGYTISMAIFEVEQGLNPQITT